MYRISHAYSTPPALVAAGLHDMTGTGLSLLSLIGMWSAFLVVMVVLVVVCLGSWNDRDGDAAVRKIGLVESRGRLLTIEGVDWFEQPLRVILLPGVDINVDINNASRELKVCALGRAFGTQSSQRYEIDQISFGLNENSARQLAAMLQRALVT